MAMSNIESVIESEGKAMASDGLDSRGTSLGLTNISDSDVRESDTILGPLFRAAAASTLVWSSSTGGIWETVDSLELVAA